MMYVIGALIVVLVIWFVGRVNKAKVDLADAQKSNLANRKPIDLSEELRAKIVAEKQSLGPNEVLIKNRLGKDVMRVSKGKWQEIQSHMDAHMWNRLDDQV